MAYDAATGIVEVATRPGGDVRAQVRVLIAAVVVVGPGRCCSCKALRDELDGLDSDRVDAVAPVPDSSEAAHTVDPMSSAVEMFSKGRAAAAAG